MIAAVEVNAILITILTIVLAAAIGVPTTLLAINLRSTNKRLTMIEDKQDAQLAKQQRIEKEISALETSQARCKTACKSEFVSAESWIRSEGYNRQQLDRISQSLSELKGNLGIVDKLPQICADISRNVVKEMKREG